MFIRTCVKVDDAEDARVVPANGAEESDASRLHHAVRASSDAQGRHSLGRCIFARLLPSPDLSLPPSLPSPPSLTVLLLPPTRRVVSHALYLEARREERVSRALILARIASALQKYVTLIFISATSSPRDDVSFILAVAMCGPP